MAALETGCRRGELLGLRWGDVSLTAKELTIRAENARDRDLRTIPISARLAAVLDMVKTDPAGRVYEATACVFGLLGEPVASIKKAWETAVLTAYGHTPEYVGTKLSANSRRRSNQRRSVYTRSYSTYAPVAQLDRAPAF